MSYSRPKVCRLEFFVAFTEFAMISLIFFLNLTLSGISFAALLWHLVNLRNCPVTKRMFSEGTSDFRSDTLFRLDTVGVVVNDVCNLFFGIDFAFFEVGYGIFGVKLLMYMSMWRLESFEILFGDAEISLEDISDELLVCFALSLFVSSYSLVFLIDDFL